jgi:hypothetical protein
LSDTNQRNAKKTAKPAEAAKKCHFLRYGTAVASGILPEQAPLRVHIETPPKHEYVYYD